MALTLSLAVLDARYDGLFYAAVYVFAVAVVMLVLTTRMTATLSEFVSFSVDKTKQVVSDVKLGVSHVVAEREAIKRESGSTLRAAGARIFGFEGTVRRSEFWIGQVCAGVLVALALLLLPGSDWFLAVLLGFVLLVVALWASWSNAFRRMRDTGANKWWTLLALIPAVNLAVVAFLGFVPTDEFRTPSG